MHTCEQLHILVAEFDHHARLFLTMEDLCLLVTQCPLTRVTLQSTYLPTCPPISNLFGSDYRRGQAVFRRFSPRISSLLWSQVGDRSERYQNGYPRSYIRLGVQQSAQGVVLRPKLGIHTIVRQSWQ